MNKQIRYTNTALTLLFGLSVFVFFGYFYRYHLVYQEQFQLFLFTSDYLAETVHKPGGLSEYFGQLLTQFYLLPWLGALIITVLLIIIQQQVLSISLLIGNKPSYIPLTFIPSLFYWILLCDEHFMLSGVIALIFTLAAVQFYTRINNKIIRILYILLMLPMLYWLTGGTFIIFGMLCIIIEIDKAEIDTTGKILLIIGSALLILISPILAKACLVQYPLSKLWIGANYYRFPMIFPFALLVLWICIIIIPLLFRYLPDGIKMEKPFIWTGLQIAVLIIATGYGISMMTDWAKEEVMKYDYYIRSKQWNAIIMAADKKAPTTPLSVAILNVALCKQGLMAEKMFHYYQNGPEGLLPSFTRDFTSPMIAGEIYYHLGFVNTAQRYTFEAMEAIPDYQKSARAVKRLAETNLINGEYTVAGKYLRMLQHTFYYRKWATNVLTYLGDEEKINSNPEWSEIRKYRTKTDFLFSEQEKDMMLGVLLQQDFTNRQAYEYLMAYCLLTKDLKHFFSYYPLGKSIQYQRIPKSYQEALIYLWGLSNKDLSAIPYPISNDVKQQVHDYGRIYTSYQDAGPMLQKQFAGTYWYYFHFRK